MCVSMETKCYSVYYYYNIHDYYYNNYSYKKVLFSQNGQTMQIYHVDERINDVYIILM